MKISERIRIAVHEASEFMTVTGIRMCAGDVSEFRANIGAEVTYGGRAHTTDVFYRNIRITVDSELHSGDIMMTHDAVVHLMRSSCFGSAR